MSVLIMAAMAAAGISGTADRIERSDWMAVARAARQADVPAIVLYDALTAPQAPRRAHQTRLCLRLTEIVEGKTGMVCRTRAEWNGFGLEFAEPASARVRVASN